MTQSSNRLNLIFSLDGHSPSLKLICMQCVMPVTGDKAVKAILCVLSEETFPSTIIKSSEATVKIGHSEAPLGKTFSGQSGVYTLAGLQLEVGRK